MIYLLIYLALGLLTACTCVYLDLFVEKIDKLTLDDLLTTLFASAIWPIFLIMAAHRAAKDTNLNQIVLWRRKRPPGGPHS